jgi:hypothetical protein
MIELVKKIKLNRPDPTEIIKVKRGGEIIETRVKKDFKLEMLKMETFKMICFKKKDINDLFKDLIDKI